MNADERILSVRHVSIALSGHQGSRMMVSDVSFDVWSGQVFGIIGESGSGKSLLCRAIMGLLPPQMNIAAGTLELNGRELDIEHKSVMRSIRCKEMGMILQNPISSFNPLLTIQEHLVETFREKQRMKRREAIEQAFLSLERVGLPNPSRVLLSYPHQLSGGMLQRVMIAIALIGEPSLLIADEPTTALDTLSQKHILQELDRLRDETAMAFVIVTHDLGVIARLADHVAVMQHGRIVETSSVSQLFDAPQHPYTRRLMKSRLRRPAIKGEV